MGIKGKLRLPRKVLFILGGVLILSGSAAGALVVLGGEKVLFTKGEEVASSGVACSVIETLKMRRNGQRWVRRYISTETTGGIERVRTGLRIAGLLAQQEKADLYQVVVLDQSGPLERANRRGPAIGAEVLFAPDPTKLPDMTSPFIARYNDASANTVGLFYGKEVDLTADEIRTAMTEMDDKSDCIDPVAIAAAENGGHGGGAAEGSASHGEAPAAEGHEEAAAPEGRDAAAPEGEGHGEEAKASGGGFFSSITGMIFGSKDEATKTPAASHEPAAPDHETAPAAEAAHGAETEHAEEASAAH